MLRSSTPRQRAIDRYAVEVEATLVRCRFKNATTMFGCGRFATNQGLIKHRIDAVVLKVRVTFRRGNGAAGVSETGKISSVSLRQRSRFGLVSEGTENFKKQKNFRKRNRTKLVVTC